MATLRDIGKEPVEGIVIASYVPKDIFIAHSAFSGHLSSMNVLKRLIDKLITRFPKRYSGVRKKSKQLDNFVVYDNIKENESIGSKSNYISLTGRVLDWVYAEPERERVYPINLDVGFTYACTEHATLLLDLFDRELILLSDKTFQPSIQMIDLSTENESVYIGNMALYLLNGGAREVTVATKDGQSIRKKSYVIAMH